MRRNEPKRDEDEYARAIAERDLVLKFLQDRARRSTTPTP
jgi:hypothetical protein